MSDDFEDAPPSGSGMPTRAETHATLAYLSRHNRPFGIRPVLAELKANGFEISFATVQRHLREEVVKPDAPEIAHIRADIRAGLQKTRPVAVTAAATPEQQETARKAVEDSVAERIGNIIGKPDNLKSNAEIALHENKIRMALNILLMQMLMERPERILVDLRGAAALIDAMTISAKVSGAAAFEVLPPGVKSDGSDMKNVTPEPVEKTATQLSIADFRRKQGK